MKKRLLSLLLMLSMVFAALPMTAGAADEPESGAGGLASPLYGGEYEEIAVQAETKEAAADQKVATYVTPETAAGQLRDAMVARKSSVTLYINTKDFWYKNGTSNWFNETLYPMAYSEELAVGVTDGDYLRWSWKTQSFKWSRVGTNQYVFEVYPTYYTSYEQEQTVLAKLKEINASLNMGKLTDHEKYTAIYDYVTSHVTYDMDGMKAYNDAYANKTLQPSHYGIFTAYAAITKGTAVCQGYATMFYTMCKLEKLPVRIVTGSNHAWNIVKLKNIWYNVDATWDSEYNGKDNWRWYLLGSDRFDVRDHTREAPFDQSAFMNAYPTSAWDYDPDIPYNDVSKSNYHYENIRKATELGIFNGIGDGQYGPTLPMQRCMLVTALWRLEQEPAAGSSAGFSDVAAGQYYEAPVAWAVKEKIVNGYEDKTFRPTRDITREEIVKLLYCYAQHKGYQTKAVDTLAGYTDQTKVQAYARPAMQWAVGAGIIKGITDTTLGPEGPATREQLATMLIRFIDYYKKQQ